MVWLNGRNSFFFEVSFLVVGIGEKTYVLQAYGERYLVTLPPQSWPK